MPRMNAEHLSTVLSQVPGFARLTPAERTELARIAQGFACNASADDAHLSAHTIRYLRRRIYRKLGLGGSGELQAVVLKFSLDLLAAKVAEASAYDPFSP